MKSAIVSLTSALLLGSFVLAAEPVTISNLASAQKAGTKTVEITYDVANTDGVDVTIELEVKNGATPIVVAPANLSGDIGDVAPGTGKKITWNAGADWNSQVANLTFNVTGTSTAPAISYLVVDLSGGAGAGSYPVSPLATLPDPVPSEYKTIKLLLRKIPAGTFSMGAPLGELGRQGDEIQHQVTLTQDFYIGVFEITQRQWELVMGSLPSITPLTANRPVGRVSYFDIRGSSAGAGWPATNDVDASSFLGKLRAKTSLTFDLPTEAQWEYACRAGTTTALNSGQNLTSTSSCASMDEVGIYSANSGGVTAVVGSKRGNAWGLYDMHGNVWEWCLDWYGSYPIGSVVDPEGRATGTNRLFRGGSRGHIAGSCRSAGRRYQCSPSIQYTDVGLRVCAPTP